VERDLGVLKGCPPELQSSVALDAGQVQSSRRPDLTQLLLDGQGSCVVMIHTTPRMSALLTSISNIFCRCHPLAQLCHVELLLAVATVPGLFSGKSS
jgi:hypothetical protein